MSYCIYLYQRRILCWLPETLYSRPVLLPGVTWYIVNNPPPMPLEEIVAKKNVGFNMQKGFYIVEDPLPPNWEIDASNIVRKIEILTALNNLSNTQKSRLTTNAIGQSLTDSLTLEEIRRYQETGSLDNCPILTSTLEMSKPKQTPEALVTRMWLTYQFYGSVIAYLNNLEMTIRRLLEDNLFDRATRVLNDEVEKIMI